MTFDLGSFDLQRIRKDGAVAIFSAEGKLEAFATWLCYWQGRGRCLDLMRSYPEAKGVMNCLIVESIGHFKHLGVEEVSLGNAPLANAEQNPRLYGREEKAVKFLFDRFNRYYGYKSLFGFKKKYQRAWQGRYLGLRPNVNLLLATVALVRVHLPQGLLRINLVVLSRDRYGAVFRIRRRVGDGFSIYREGPVCLLRIRTDRGYEEANPSRAQPDRHSLGSVCTGS